MIDINLNDVADKLGMQRSGKNRGSEVNYFCPVHDQKTPDLDINNGTKFHCLPSGEGGKSPVTLVMHVKQVDTGEAVEWLKQHFPDEFEDVDEEFIFDKQDALDVLDRAASLAHQSLKQSKLWNEIKERRSFTEETMEKARIGLLTYDDVEVLKKRFDKKHLLRSGLFGESEDGDLYCILANRITYPYQAGNTVKYMVGRRTGDDESVPKYKKIRNTDYNQHILLKYTPEEADRSTLVVTEGVTDAISVMQAGVNVVSPVTKQFRDKDIDKLVRVANHFDDIYLAFDADEAGQSGQRKTAIELGKSGVENEPGLLGLPDGMDMDDWTSKNGYELGELFDSAEFFLDVLVDEANEAGRRKQPKIIDEVAEVVGDWDPVYYDSVVKQLPGRAKDLRKIFKQGGNTTEATEATEPTEPVFPTNQDGFGGDEIDSLLKQEKNESFRMSGIKNQYNIHTVFIQEGGMTKPLALIHNRKTGETNYQWVKYKKKQVQKNLAEGEELSKEEHKKYDYYFITVENKELRYIHQPSDLGGDIETASNDVLRYTIKEPETLENNLLDKVENQIRSFWDHYHEEWYETLAAWTIHTYLLQDLSVTPYIVFRGQPNTGKSVCQETLDKMAYNSFQMEDPTIASIQRSVNFAQSTVHLDELDDMGDEATQKLQKTCNSGYQKGARRTMINTEKDDIEESIEKLYTYSAKTFAANNTYNLSDPILDRSLIINSVEAGRDLENIRELTDDQLKMFQDLRNQLMAYTLLHRKELVDSISESREQVDVSNRAEDKVAPIHGIIKHFRGKEAADKIADFVSDQKNLTTQTTDEVNQSVKAYIVNQAEASGCKILLKDLARFVNTNVSYMGENSEMRATSRSMGRRLQRMGFFRMDSQKSRFGSGGEMGVKIPLEFIRDVLQRNGDKHLLTKISDLGENKGKSPQSGTPNDQSTGSVGSVASVASVVDSPIHYHTVTKNAIENTGSNKGSSFKQIYDYIRNHNTDLTENVKNWQQKINKVIEKLLDEGTAFETPDGKIKLTR